MKFPGQRKSKHYFPVDRRDPLIPQNPQLTELGKAARGVSKVHRSIAAGVFGTLGRTPLRTWSDPTRAVHDAISEGV